MAEKKLLGGIELNRIYQRDCIEGMRMIPDESVDLIFTSPPYNIGKEYETLKDLDEYVDWMSDVIEGICRVVSSSGSVVFQVGNYVRNGAVFPLDCILFPEFVKRGLKPRNRIVWTFGHGLHCTNRLSGRHETALWFSRGEEYTFNLDDIRVPQKYPNKRYYKGPKKGQLSGNPLGKNPGDVWDISNVKNNHPEKTAHPCQFPEELALRFIRALTKADDVVLDPFLGSGTTAIAATLEGRDWIGFETESKYVEIANMRLDALNLTEEVTP
ncbi:site-specific DNA-methyltransferase [Bifidobacterium pullorum subsp. gallinarum]